MHDPEVQKKVFEVIGLSDEEAREKFGFLIDALTYGAPPHGGIAFGMDRVAMLAAETCVFNANAAGKAVAVDVDRSVAIR